MSEIISTRLRYAKAKDPEALVKWVNGLGFRIEIKGAPVKDGKFWFLWFILPESPQIKMNNVEV